VKIDKPVKPMSPALQDAAARTPAKGNASLPATPQSDATSVSLGSTAAQLRNLAGDMANAPVVNAAKVAEIKQAISEGRFKVNTDIVADNLLETVRGLIGSKA